MTSQTLKVGQVWQHRYGNTYLIVGISTCGKLYDLLRVGTSQVCPAYPLWRHIDYFTKISEWDGKLRKGQRWECRDNNTWLCMRPRPANSAEKFRQTLRSVI